MTITDDHSVKGAIAWGSVGSIGLRLGSLGVGIFLARMFVPEDFAVFAVALTVSTVLTSIADLGLSSGLVRSKDPHGDAPTTATISLVVGCVFALVLLAAAPLIERTFAVEGSAAVVAVLGLSIPLASAGVVPYAFLLRRFDQKSLLAAASADFVVSAAVTVVLVLADVGPMSLAIARIAGQLCATGVQFFRADMLPHFGFDRSRLRPALAFGAPIAAANVLSWSVVSIDNLVVARVVGDVALGFYALAFNISTWPTNAMGTIVRAVALPWFARESEQAGGVGGRRAALARAGALTWAGALPTGVLLAVMAAPVISVLYGDRWTDASGALVALGVFATLRVMFDLFATYLLAHGASRVVLTIQVLWIGILVPASIVGARVGGIEGVGWSHTAVGLVVVLPLYLIAVHRVGADIGALGRAAIRPLMAFVPAAAAAFAAVSLISNPWLAVVTGGGAAACVYAAALHGWVVALMKDENTTAAPRRGVVR
ncbi:MULTISPECIES: oligosaccharide flippase family protein [unclassified Rhodococcus (in: high G+C Gram-positive bacteria)]|uniref:oligosaccharide flippase family protein n=1 Tax=unclassified Rhodococcus (in: high G+C Gram-positive bacteria) TaxID=192944 RepID=UPI002E298252|nr:MULTISPECIES: oligosaccharide flippase family protein [unclassified Rhodococcus (in: high G+C Gram-positive bacteria)]